VIFGTQNTKNGTENDYSLLEIGDMCLFKTDPGLNKHILV